MKFTGLFSFRNIILQSPSTFQTKSRLLMGEWVGTWPVWGPLAVVEIKGASSVCAKEKACSLQAWGTLSYASAGASGLG